MSWEVSTMPSKRSFCNLTLLRKNLARFWPLWGGAALAGALLPLWLLLNLSKYGAGHVDGVEFAHALYTVAVRVAPAVCFVYAILCAMMVWSYLFSPRAVGLMHALPIDRTCLFLTNALSGLAMLLIPYATTGTLVCLIALCWGFLHIGAALETAALIILISLIFFGMATFCAMITGNAFAMPAFYLLLNFLFPALELLVGSISQLFLVGVTSQYMGTLECLSPLLMLYSGMDTYVEDGAAVLLGAPVAAAYGLVGIALLAASFVIYRLRRSECAGDVVAFRWLRPVFRYGVALAFALTLGWFLYEIIWDSLFQRGSYADFVPMAVCMAFTGVIGYYVASMLLEKSLRVFRRSWPGVLTVCAGVVILCGCMRFDVLGMESRVPRQEDVAQVTVSYGGRDITADAGDAGIVSKVLALHKAVASDADYIRDRERYEANGYLHLRYYDSDGDTLLYRSYRLPVSEERMETPGTYEYLLRQLLLDPQVMLSQVELPRGSQILEASVDDYGTGSHASCAGETAEAVYQAILRDAEEGRLYGIYGVETKSYPATVYVRAILDDGRDVDNLSVYLELCPTMTHTMDALLDAGLLSAEAVAAWDRELGGTAYGTVSA